MEPRGAETEATVHAVCSQLQCFLSNVKLAELNWISFAFYLVFDEFTLFNEGLKNRWKDSVF